MEITVPNGTTMYISVNAKNRAICVLKGGKPQPFSLMPLIKEKIMNITIYKLQPELDSPRFLGNSLECINKAYNMELTMTKPADILEKESRWKM